MTRSASSLLILRMLDKFSLLDQTLILEALELFQRAKNKLVEQWREILVSRAEFTSDVDSLT